MLLPFAMCVLILYVPLPLSSGGMPSGTAWLGVAVLVALNAVVCWAASSVAIRVAGVRGAADSLVSTRLFTALKGMMVGFVLADVVALNWPLAVEELLAGRRWAILWPDCLLLLPVLAMAFTLMAFQYRVERRTGRVSLALPRWLWLRFRVEMAVVLVPWLMLVVVSEAADAIFYGSPLAATADSIASGMVLAGVVVFSPLLLRAIWANEPLPDGPLRRRLETYCKRQGFRCRDILLWRTYGHLANAGVVGPTPLLRYVMLTDALVQRCEEREVEAVFAHEVGHARHHHLAFYALLAAAFVCFYVNLVDLAARAGWVEPIHDVFSFQMTARQGAVMLAFAAVYWGLVFGYISRRMEQEADLFALRTIEEPASFLTALARLAAVGGVPHRAGSWRHFSIAHRLEFLHGVLADPAREGSFRRRSAALKAAMLGLFAAAAFRLLVCRPDLLGI